MVSFRYLTPIGLVHAQFTTHLESIDLETAPDSIRQEAAATGLGFTLANKRAEFLSIITNPGAFRTPDVCDGCIQFESNVGNSDGNCITTSIGATCVGFDPETCEEHLFAPHVRVKKCIPGPGELGNNPGYRRQCHFYDDETGQIYDEDGNCLTLMAPDDVDFEFFCDACGTMDAGGFPDVGGLVYTWPCVPGGTIYQSWTINKGVIQSNCAHGYYLADIFPFMHVQDFDEFGGGKLLRFGDEYEIDEKFPQSGGQLIDHLLGQTWLEKIGGHGCWCSRFGTAGYSGGGSQDELDSICKDWATARRCMYLEEGSCHGSGQDGTYIISEDKEGCPWSEEDEIIGDLTCGETGGHLNDEGCLKDVCLVDLKYIELIEKFIEENGGESFEPTPGSQGICHPGTGGGNSQVVELTCVGVAPDLSIERSVNVASP